MLPSAQHRKREEGASNKIQYRASLSGDPRISRRCAPGAELTVGKEPHSRSGMHCGQGEGPTGRRSRSSGMTSLVGRRKGNDSAVTVGLNCALRNGDLPFSKLLDAFAVAVQQPPVAVSRKSGAAGPGDVKLVRPTRASRAEEVTDFDEDQGTQLPYHQVGGSMW